MNPQPSTPRIARTPRTASLYNRILALIALIFLLMAIIIAIGVLLFVYSHEKRLWNERQVDVAHHAANQVARYIKGHENSLDWLSRFGFDDMNANPGFLEDFIKDNPAFLEIAFLDQNGNTLMSGAEEEPILANQFTVRQSQWFRLARSGRKNYSRIQTSPKGESYIIFAMPFRSNGVVVAQIKMDGLWREVAGITFGESGSVYIINMDGQIIAHKNPSFVLANRSIADFPQFKSILQAPNNEYAGDGEDLRGSKVKIVSSHIDSTRWIVITELPEREAFAISQNAFVFIPLSLFMLTTISAILFRRILRKEFLLPVEQLRTGAILLSQGELSYRLDIPKRRDELSQVMVVFNSMASELEGRQTEQKRHADEIAQAYMKMRNELVERQKAEAALKRLNDELEQRVKERTESLLKTNTELRHEIAVRQQSEAQRHKLETQLQQAQKMEAIGTLAGGIAHDFNNILGAIIGYAEMIHDDCPPDSQFLRDIEQVLLAANRARDLVKQILTFSRQAKADRVPLPPASIIREALKLLRSSIPTTIAIKQNIDPNVGTLLADPTQIHQILMNLCTNAFHAMEEEGGTLTVSLSATNLAEGDPCLKANMAPGRYMQLSVKDTGSGIAPEILDKIYDPYFTTKEVGKGTGMGLSMVHGIVQSYSGSILCTSQPGRGTEFLITLPLLEEHALLVDKGHQPIPHGREHILLVEDEEILLDMGRIMLERLGYRVTGRRNGLEALTCFQDQPDLFDLIVTDQTMPGMTGVDLSRRILQIRPGMPIILCTGYSNLISEEQAKTLGIKGFAMKPLARKSAAELIRKILDEVKN